MSYGLELTPSKESLPNYMRVWKQSVRPLASPKESRRFHPHLTIARLRKPEQARTLAAAHKAMEIVPAEIQVSELLVIRSELSSAGSKYTVISRYPLVQR